MSEAMRALYEGDEERARRHYDEHGVWPDEDEWPRERRWHLPAGAVTAEDEERERRGA